MKFFESKLFRNTLVYAFANGLNAAIPLILLPYLTRKLETEAFGMVAQFITLLSFTTILIGFCLHSLIFNREFKNQTHQKGNELAQRLSVLFICVSSFAIHFLLLFILRQYWTDLFSLSTKWISIIFVSSLFQSFFLQYVTTCQARGNAGRFFMSYLAQTALHISFAVYALEFTNWGWEGRVSAIAGSYILTGTVAFFILYGRDLSSNVFKRIQITELKNEILFSLTFCLPIIVHAVGGLLISMYDRVIIGQKLSLADAGIYQAGLQLSLFILFLTDSFNKAFAPWLYTQLQTNTFNQKVKIVKGTYLAIAALMFITFITSLIPDSWLLFILGERYIQSLPIFPLACLAYSLNGCYLLVCNYLFYAEKTRNLALITLPVGLISLVLNYTLIGTFGIMGAIYSMVFSYGLLFLFTWRQAAKAVPMPWFSFVEKN